ncbi:hypothetical protein GQ42DRAFT_85712 [Ramicandelaber brevisporus]|nr:hypothetical protein GQ42DRAFT_85712 [Ramicandelaber brevisporus]
MALWPESTENHNIRFKIGNRLFLTPSAAVYLVQVPQLEYLKVCETTCVDIDETIRLLNGCAKSESIRHFTWSPIEWHHELALAMVMKMPNLDQFSARRCPEKYRAAFEQKYKCSWLKIYYSSPP